MHDNGNYCILMMNTTFDTKTVLISVILLIIPVAHSFLSIDNSQHFVYNNQTVFLSGVNAPWVHYGRDFGSGAYKRSKAQFEQWFDRIATNGGNVVRVWVFVDARNAPKFDAKGFATGEDTESLIEELGKYLDYAEKKNVFAILCLWNGAVKPLANALNLFSDDEKLERYLEKVLKPLVYALKSKKALASWEVINEVGGSVQQDITDANPCFDTRVLHHTGANWAGTNLTMKNALKFINWHIDAIKSADPKALVTSGAWSEIPNIERSVCSYCYKYYSDECVRAAGGKQSGVLDYYQIHTYRHNSGKYADFSPMLKTTGELKLDKLVIIGELSAKCESNKTPAQCYQWAYGNGYSGILGWRYDADGDRVGSVSHSEQGMLAIKDMTTNGVISSVKIV